MLPSWIASLTSPSTRSFPASSTALGGHTVYPAQPAVRPPQGQRRRDGARPTRPHLFDAFGHLPDIGTGGRVGYVWSSTSGNSTSDATPRAGLHRPAPLQWHRLRPASRFGIDSGDFAALLCRSGLVAHCRFCRPLSARWIAFHGCYDFAYLIKVLGNGTPLPDTLEEFLGLVNLLFGETVDLKYMMFGCEGLSGGLESVASTLGVPRQAGKSHQAGSDSLVTYQVYLKMKRRFFNDRDATVARHRGIIYGLHAC
ncbi:CAF1 family ribonuclease [Musa troglodytarum]|uniref:poly(A)-specific ribonuclease n=1 Tax=Musa troglodytarum TaxID=320322 RepID=A0A9E7JIB8_9LILI|nr:CAF1 family ribonuclease [Musa troglodytarum]